MKIAHFQPIDMISDLPDNIIESILMCLAIRDAVKTSVLSRQWRYKWVKLPMLKFDYTLWQESERNQELARMKFVEILYQVLLRHQGSITKSSLVIPRLIGGSEIDHLIYILWKKGVEKFTLKMTNMEVYKLPSSLFMCSQLEHLNLSSCSISPPPSFKGFNRLITLKLLDVVIDTEVLGSLISSSPKLEQLVLHVPAGFRHLKIDAPKLKLVGLKCYHAYVYFKNSPLLAIVSVASTTMNIHDIDDIERDTSWNLIEFFESLPALQQLCINCNMMRILAAGPVQARLPVTFVHLKILRLICMWLDSLDDLSYVLCLIRSSPNLEELKLEIMPRPWTNASRVLDFLKLHDYSDIFLTRLQKVKLERIYATVPEMTLIKLLLEKSPKLEKMVIRLKRPLEKLFDKGFGILTQMNKFKRASPNAKVIFKAKDESEIWYLSLMLSCFLAQRDQEYLQCCGVGFVRPEKLLIFSMGKYIMPVISQLSNCLRKHFLS